MQDFPVFHMREWLSGGAPPCQGGGRGFDSRLALSTLYYPKVDFILSKLGVVHEKCTTFFTSSQQDYQTPR